MSFLHASEILSDAARSDAVYLCCPDVLDFTTTEAKGDVVLHCQGGDKSTFSLDKQNVLTLWSLFQLSIFAAGKRVIGWNLKNLFSYFRYFGKKDFKVQAGLIDLRLLESYLGVSQPHPEAFGDAHGRVRHIFNSGAWKGIQGVYKRVHLPLLTRVIPALETGGLLDKRREAAVHAHYKIEGQSNGRLKCDKAFVMSFLPHSLGEEDREALMPRRLNELFLYFDYRSLEVSVLQWLTQDKKLEEALASADVYATIFETVTGNKCAPGQREMAKNFFLAVIYGQSANGLLEEFTKQGLNISLPNATAIVTRVNQVYGTAVDWLTRRQEEVTGSHVARDHFGRRREFPDSAYKVRNFLVQAPASTICLDKLVQLQRSIPVVMHIHDGYVVTATKNTWQETYMTAKAILEKPDDFYPGLRLRVSCKAGRNLNRLKPIGKKGVE